MKATHVHSAAASPFVSISSEPSPIRSRRSFGLRPGVFSSLRWVGLCLLAAALFAAPALAAPTPVPFLNNPLVPDTAVPGAADFTLTVNGTGFLSGATVDWNGAALTTTFVSSSQLTATVPASDVATAGTASVTVVNPGGLTSNVDFFPVATTNSSPTFTLTPASPIALGASAGYSETFESAAIADFNGDGNQDVVITNPADGTVSVLLGNGDGTFTEASGSPFTVTGHPVAVAVGDVNGDGVPDIAAADGLNSDVSILLGKGDGTFSPYISVPTQYEPTYVVLADFNGDGILDMATASTQNHTYDILLGNGDGTFTTAPGSPVTISSSAENHTIAVGDFDGDGILDIAVTTLGEPMLVLHGNGDGTFTTATTIDMSSLASSGDNSVVAGDINHDGKLDLLVSGGGSSSSGDVVIELGNGDATFTQSLSSAGFGPDSVVLGDLNGNGNLDMAIDDAGAICDPNCQFALATQIGNGDATFQASSFSNLSLAPRWTGEADFNNDGRLDLVTLGVNSTGNVNNLFVFLQGQSAVSAPAVSFSPTSLDFGNQTVGVTSSAMSVTVTNTGNADLTFGGAAVSLSGANSADFSISSDSCSGSTVSASSTCTVGVTFTPSVASAESASLDFADNASGSPQSVVLSGTGTAATSTATLSASSLTFSGEDVGSTSSAQKLTLTNSGNAALSISGVSVSSGFAQSNDCGSSVAASSSCTFSVTFDPSATGPASGSLTITDSAADSPQSVSLSGTGEDFGFSATTSSQTISAGASASFSLQLSPEGGFNGAVSLSCSGAPAHATCSVSPASVTLDGSNNSTATVNVTTTAPSLLFPDVTVPPTMPPATVWIALLGLLALLALFTLARQSRRHLPVPGKRLLLLAPLAMAILLLAAPFVLSGCNNSPPAPSGGTPAGTTTLTVTAKSGSLTHSTSLTLTVQ